MVTARSTTYLNVYMVTSTQQHQNDITAMSYLRVELVRT
jgi:hypothetical protein